MIKTETVVGVFDTDKGLTSVATPSGVGQTYLMSYNPTTQTITDPAQRNAVAEAAGRTLSPNKRSVSRSLSGYMQPFAIGSYGGRTYRAAITVPANFVGARLVLRNPSTSDVNWTGPIYFAPSNQPTGNNPSGSWTQVTFNAGQTTGVIPAGKGDYSAGNCTPGVLVSDWVPVASVARADGSLNRVLYVSGYADPAMSSLPNMGNTSQPTTNWADKNDADVAGRTFECRSASGSLANSASFDSGGTGAGYGNPFVEVEFLLAEDCATILGMGDSITNGDGPTMKMASPVHFAAVTLSNAGKLCVASNHGYSSQKTNTFSARLRSILVNQSCPDVVVYSAWSPNDFGQAQDKTFAAAQMRENVEVAARLCRQHGVSLVLSTGTPCNIGAEDSIRVAFNAWVVDFAAKNNLKVVDYSAVVSDPADSTNILASLRTDTIHPNLAGYKAMATALVAVLNNII